MTALQRLMLGVLALVTASCASTPAPQAPTVNVTGDWVGKWVCEQNEGEGIILLKLTQTGSQVTGDVNVTGTAINRSTATGEAMVSGDQLVLRNREVSGTWTVTGDKIEGPFKGTCIGTVSLTRAPWTGTLMRSRLRTVVMTVEALDLGTRMITLRGPSGSALTMQVDERVRNLPQVSVGDTVTVAYYESWALSLDKPGDPSTAMVVGRAAPGQMPAGFAARRSTIEATVTAIDGAKPSVTFRGPKGGTQEVGVAEDPRVLARLKVGETYNVTYTENLAVAVEKAKPR